MRNLKRVKAKVAPGKKERISPFAVFAKKCQYLKNPNNERLNITARTRKVLRLIWSRFFPMKIPK